MTDDRYTVVEIARELVTLLSAILTAGAAPAFAAQPRTAADCHAPTRQQANERENAVNALGVVAGKRRVEAQSAERALRKRQHQYLTAKQAQEEEQRRDAAQRKYLLAQREYLTAKQAQAEEQRRVKKCLDAVADAERSMRVAASASPPPPTRSPSTAAPSPSSRGKSSAPEASGASGP